MTDGERPRSEGNASEYDTDFECEEEEVGGVQSDGSLFSEGGQGSGGVAGRKRLHSEAATAAANINLTEMPSSSRDAKCKQASNLHNEREKERRKDLKQAVHSLRNQLQLHQTKKATTISVLKASEMEIKDLLQMEEAQNRKLTELQTQQKHLVWKLEGLMAERKKDAPRPLGMSGSTSSPAAPPILPSPLSVLPPPLTTMAAPVFYMPSTPGAANSPSIPASPHTPPFMMQAHRPISPSTFPFGASFGFPHPALLSSASVFSPMVTHPHHAFSIHPAAAARPFLVMPSASPASFAIPPFFPRLPSSPGRFVFPSGPGTPPPHLPSPSLLLHSFSPPGPMPLPQFPVFLSQPPGRSQPSPPTDSSDTEATPQASPTIPHDKHIYRENTPASPESPLPIQKSTDSFPPEEQGDGLAISEREESTFRYRRYSTDGGEPIDVETPDQEEGETTMDEHEREVQPFLGIRCPHRKQRKRRGRKMRVPDAPYPLEKTKTRQTRRTPTKPPEVLCIAGTNDAPRNLAEGHSTSRDRFSLKGPELLINDAIEQGAEEKRFHFSPLAIDLAPRLPTVICS